MALNVSLWMIPVTHQQLHRAIFVSPNGATQAEWSVNANNKSSDILNIRLLMYIHIYIHIYIYIYIYILKLSYKCYFWGQKVECLAGMWAQIAKAASG
jgi:hypothetical protein